MNLQEHQGPCLNWPWDLCFNARPMTPSEMRRIKISAGWKKIKTSEGSLETWKKVQGESMWDEMIKNPSATLSKNEFAD